MALIASPSPLTTVQIGSGTLLYHGVIGKWEGTNRRFPMRITRMGLPSWMVESFDTTALDTIGPSDNTQFGGRTFGFGVVEDPGQITLDGFLNVDVALPRGMRMFQIRFALKKGFKTKARMTGTGFIISQTNNEAAINVPMPTQVIIKMTGFVTRVPAMMVDPTP